MITYKLTRSDENRVRKYIIVRLAKLSKLEMISIISLNKDPSRTSHARTPRLESVASARIHRLITCQDWSSFTGEIARLSVVVLVVQ